MKKGRFQRWFSFFVLLLPPTSNSRRLTPLSLQLWASIALSFPSPPNFLASQPPPFPALILPVRVRLCGSVANIFFNLFSALSAVIFFSFSLSVRVGPCASVANIFLWALSFYFFASIALSFFYFDLLALSLIVRVCLCASVANIFFNLFSAPFASLPAQWNLCCSYFIGAVNIPPVQNWPSQNGTTTINHLNYLNFRHQPSQNGTLGSPVQTPFHNPVPQRIFYTTIWKYLFIFLSRPVFAVWHDCCRW